MIPLRTLPCAGQQSGGIREFSSKPQQQQRVVRGATGTGKLKGQGKGERGEVRSDAGVHACRSLFDLSSAASPLDRK
jgi:hypothetical protein